MKRRIIPIIIVGLFLCSGILVYAADAEPLVRLPTGYVTMLAKYGPDSWFNMSISDIPQGYDVTNGQYYGWCAQENVLMSRGLPHAVALYSSYDPEMPDAFRSDNWSKINYMLNHKQGDRESIAKVIWYYMDIENYPSDLDAKTMIADADANGKEFVPQPGEIIAILVDGIPSIQQTFFEFKLPGAVPLGNLVWNDIDADGIQDMWEPGLPGVVVQLYNITGALVDSTTTDTRGYYSFTYITPGQYFVQFALPNGYKFSPQDKGTDDTVDSDANPGNGRTNAITIEAGVNDSSWDAGMYNPEGPRIVEQKNHAPTADVSAGLPYTGFVGEAIIFNGSRSYDRDGFIVSYYWDFGDGTNGSGVIISHNYSQPGKYTVRLTVTDDDGATNTNTIKAVIIWANCQPNAPVVTGPGSGKKDIFYEYTAISTDKENDTLQYIFNWGDGKNSTTEFISNGTLAVQSHYWAAAGRYIIAVKAFDNSTYSEASELAVLIDAVYVGNLGYLLDMDGDGTYDTFHSNTTGLETQVEKTANGNYLLDTDGDGAWDYDYNLGNNEIKEYHEEAEKASNGYLGNLVAGALFLAVILLVGFLVLGKNKKSKPSSNGRKTK